MSLKKFTIESLATIDGGRVKVAVETAIRQCVADCYDRAALKDGRKVTLVKKAPWE